MARLNRFWRALFSASLVYTVTAMPVWAVGEEDLRAAQRAVRLQDFEEAFVHYRSAARAGNLEAQYQLGNLYWQGRGTHKSEDQARHWFEQASASGHAAAQFALAQMLLANEPERARALLTAAAEQGHGAARTQLQRQPSGVRISEQASIEAQWFGAARSGQLELLQTLLDQQPDLLGRRDQAGRTALFYAVTSSQDAAVEWLLARGENVNHRDNLGLTAVQAALEVRNAGLLQKLLRAGGDKDQTFRNGDNLLHYAIRLQLYDQIADLLRLGVSVNHQNQRGWTPLDMAEYQKATRTVAQLKQSGARHGDAWTQQRAPQDLAAVSRLLADERLPAAAKAIVNSNRPLLEKLLREDPRAAHVRLDDGSTLLILAVKHRKPEMVQALLQHPVEVRQRAYRGVTALHVAVQTGQLNLVQMLLGAGADPVQVDDNGRDALIVAMEERHEDISARLLERLMGDSQRPESVRVHLGVAKAPVDQYLLVAAQYQAKAVVDRLLPYASANSAVDDQQRNALWFAAADANAELVRKLLDAKVDARRADAMGRTPLFIAVDSGCLECARLLVGRSDLDHVSVTGNTALIHAASRGDAPMTLLLLQNGANLEARNHRGETAVMLAVKGDHMPAVRHLLDANANVTRKNRLGRSALDLSREVSPQMHELVRSKTVLGIF